MKITSLIGQKFGKLTVKERVENIYKSKSTPNGHLSYSCDCDCGSTNIIATANHLKTGHTQSCGCIFLQYKNLIDQKFGKLIVIKKVDNIYKSKSKPHGHTAFSCNCECGNQNIIVASNSLIRGRTQSCGCVLLQYEDLVGSKFGKWTVIERVENIYKSQYKPNGTTAYNCKCECGSQNIISAITLKKGETQSCGCASAINENNIEKFLQFNKFNFTREQRLKEINKNFPNFYIDYFIENFIILEYNGEQHYKPVRFGGISMERAQENFNKQVERDRKLEKFCKENRFKLIIIDGEKYKGKELQLYLKNIILPKINKLIKIAGKSK